MITKLTVNPGGNHYVQTWNTEEPPKKKEEDDLDWIFGDDYFYDGTYVKSIVPNGLNQFVITHLNNSTQVVNYENYTYWINNE